MRSAARVLLRKHPLPLGEYLRNDRGERTWRARLGQGSVQAYARGISKGEIHRLLGRDDPLILEIGCNDGADTVEFLDEFSGCTIYCFECDPRPIADFRRRIDDPRCELVEVAVAAHDGFATLNMSGGTAPNVPKDWDLSSSLLPPKRHLKENPWVTFDRQCQVPTTRLDTWADEAISSRAVDFVWLDVQGAEHLVIEGGRSTFSRTRFCYFEYSDLELYEGSQTLRHILRELGTFRLIATYEGYNGLAVNTAPGSSDAHA